MMGSYRLDRVRGGVRFECPNIPRFIVAVPTAAGSAYRELRPKVETRGADEVEAVLSSRCVV